MDLDTMGLAAVGLVMDLAMNEYYSYLVNGEVRLPVVVRSDTDCEDVMIVVAQSHLSC